MYDLETYRPVKLDDLIRVGRDMDGGYVIPMRLLFSTKYLLSFGICDDFSFEKEFLSKTGSKIELYGYDYSVSRKPQIKEILKNLFFVFYHFASLSFSKIKLDFQKIKAIIQNKKEINNFFQNSLGKHFVAKFIGKKDDGVTTTFETIFKALNALYGGERDIEDLSVFIKMDIEGSEYDTLPQLFPYLKKVNGLAIEFHGLNFKKERKEFENIFDVFSEEFYIAHVHGNNVLGEICLSDIPAAFEVTFINKKLISGQIELSFEEYPLKGLDYPNDPDYDDVSLRL
jgi:hypothetical protein